MTNTQMLFWVLGNAFVWAVILLKLYRTMLHIKNKIDGFFDMHNKDIRQALIEELSQENEDLTLEVSELSEQEMSRRIEIAKRGLREC